MLESASKKCASPWTTCDRLGYRRLVNGDAINKNYDVEACCI